MRNAVSNPTGTPPRPQQKLREEREIESWLGELRGGTAPPPARPAPRPGQPGGEPTSDQTRAIPTQRMRGPSAPQAEGDSGDATTAIPTPRKSEDDATEKFSAQEGEPEERQRRPGGVSAQELLRREGRL